MPNENEDMNEAEESEIDADEVPRVFRIHGIGKIDAADGNPTRTRLLVEDEDDCDIRILVEKDTRFGGESQTLRLGDNEIVEFIRALELVAKRRGLIDPSGN